MNQNNKIKNKHDDIFGFNKSFPKGSFERVKKFLLGTLRDDTLNFFRLDV